VTSVVAALLAAGAGSRFEGPTHKLLAPLAGRPLYEWALDSVRASGLPVVVVVGDVELELPDDVARVDNPDWAGGIATSLQAAVRAAGDADAVVVGLADQPRIPTEAWQLVAAVDAPIAVATYGGERGNPVRLDRSVWPLLPTTGDVGARKLAREREDLVVEVACPGNPADVDRLEDLERWS
jgi:CTP:molybdopterin cytidylyltransferase MocA